MSGKLCRDVRQEIDQTELRQPLSASSEAHVSECASCTSFKDERRRLRELVSGLQPVTAPPDFEMRLRARIARERDVPKQRFIFRFVMSTPAIVVAAVVVIVVAAIVFMGQRNRSQTPSLASGNSDERLNATPPSPTVAQEQTPEPVQTAGPVNDGTRRQNQSTLAVRSTPRSNVPVNAGAGVDDMAVKGAQPVRMIDRNGEVSLTAPLRPMVVTMYDEHGGTRKVELPPISFGSQRLTDKRTQVSMTNTRDW